MPAAKPLKSKKYATIKRKREKVFSPEIDRLLTYLMENEILSDIISSYQPDAPGFGTGDYDPRTKEIAVIAGDTAGGDVTAAHEIVHLLAGRESKVDRMSKEIEKLPFLMKRDLVFPKHWTEGKVPDISDKIVWPGGGSRLQKMLKKTSERRLNEVRDSIGEDAKWSGIPPTSYGPFMHRDAYGEGAAYHMTSPKVATPMGESAKEFGMYLLNHNVPMKLVEPIVKRLSGIAKPENRWSGGSYELEQMRKRKEKNPGYRKLQQK